MGTPEDVAAEKYFTPPGETPEPICSTTGRHYIENPEGNTCAKCKYCPQWFAWDYGKHKYIPL